MNRRRRKLTDAEREQAAKDLPELIKLGLANPDGTLTDAGELKLLQLEMREWCVTKWPKILAKREAQKAERRKQWIRKNSSQGSD